MRVDLESVTISAFMNIAEEQTINFRKNCLYGIFGENKDTGNSNGSGKTSFINAINVGILGLSATGLTSKDVRNKILDLPPKISVSLSINDRPLLIERTIGGKLRINFNNDGWKEGSVDDVQNEIERLIGLNKDQILRMTFKKQGDFGGFLLMKDSEKKEFLGSFINLEKIEKSEIYIKNKLNELSGESVKLKYEISSATESINNNNKILNPLLSELQEITNKQSADSVENLKKELAVMEQAAALQQENYDKLLDSAEVKLAVLSSNEAKKDLFAALKDTDIQIERSTEKEEEINSKISSFLPTLNELKGKKENAIRAISKFKQMESDFNAAQLKIQSLEKDKLIAVNENEKLLRDLDLVHNKHDDSADACFACKRPLDWGSKEAVTHAIEKEKLSISKKIESNTKKIQLIDNDISGLQTTAANLSALVNPNNLLALQSALSDADAAIKSMESGGLSELSSELSSIKSGLSYLLNQKNMITKKLATVDLDLNTKIESIKSKEFLKIKELKSSIELTKAKLDMTEKRIAAIKNSLEQISKQNEEKETQASLMNIKLNEIENETLIAQKISHILSRQGFVGYLFDSMLEEINNEVNKNLKQLPLTSNFQLYFSPDKITKSSGNVSKNITYEIINSGIAISFEALSGAEKLSVILAVEEAVDHVTSKRSGVHIGWKFLDEQLMFVDSGNKEFVMEFLKEKSLNKTIMIVDHASEFNAAIENRIKVTKENGMARITHE